MKAKKIFSFVLAASLMAACSNEDVIDSNNGVNGQMMSAADFSLVGAMNDGDAESRASYLPQYVYLNGTAFVAGVVQPKWEAEDAVGFTHIYPSDQKLVTNYRFDITSGVGTSNSATFTTTNSTIFSGDYFVYYPFNEDYHDYDGIPFALDAVQTQNAEADAVVKVGTISAPLDENEIARLTKAGAHLTKYRFSVANRIQAEPAVNQTTFALNQYTSTLSFLIYPKNQTNTIHIQRIEMVSANGTALEIPTSVRFNAVAGQAEPVAAVATKAENAVLLFENVAAGGLEILASGTKETATLAYMSMIPATYAKDSYKFVVYYQENGIMKKREVASYKDLVLNSNATTFFNIELDANGAIEVVDNEIWTETEFASAVAKSNKVTNGAVEYVVMQNIELNNSYELKSAVPVTFKGGKTITLAADKNLDFNSAKKIVFDNVISAETSETRARLNVKQGEVEIKGVNSYSLAINNEGKTTILNADAAGKVELVNNYKELTLANVAVKGNVKNGIAENGSDKAELVLSDATVGGDLFANADGGIDLDNVEIDGKLANTKGDLDLNDVAVDGDLTNTKGDLVAKDLTVGGSYTSANGAQTVAAEMENITVKGNFVQQGGELNLTGTNVLAYNATTGAVSNFFSYNNEVNVTNSTTTVGNLGQSKLYLAEGSDDAVVFTVKNISNLTSGFVLVDANATYNAEGKIEGLKGNGNPAASTMCLEGKLTTNGVVELDGDFSICGTIENKANGLWTVNSSKGVLKFNHSHTTAPEFINGGKVVVEGIKTTADVNSIAKVKMAKDLYSAESTGILEWKGMQNLTNVNAIYALGAECYATDLYAQLVADTETFAAGLNWSNKNIIAEVTDVVYVGTFAKDKKFSAKNFTVITNGTAGNDSSFKLTGNVAAGEYVVNVTETLSLENATDKNGAIDLTSSICKDLYVFNEEVGTTGILSIANGLKMNYTETYVPAGHNYNVTWVNDKPVKK